VWDEDGKRYLDFGAGIAVTSIGHCHPRVVATMQRQIATLVHTSNLYYTRPQGELAERLVRLTCAPDAPRGKVFFCNSGAEANEALYKLARKFGNEGAPPPPLHNVGEEIGPCAYRTGIITMHGSFHGRTIAGISATGQDKVKKDSNRCSPALSMCHSMMSRRCSPRCRIPARSQSCSSRFKARSACCPQRRSFSAMRAIFAIVTSCC
jgi:acetylornithine/succinyldiaminopimelate/putrescine aminotransferase